MPENCLLLRAVRATLAHKTIVSTPHTGWGKVRLGDFDIAAIARPYGVGMDCSVSIGVMLKRQREHAHTTSGTTNGSR